MILPISPRCLAVGSKSAGDRRCWPIPITSASWASRNGGDVHRLMIAGSAGRTYHPLYATHNPQLKAAVAWYGKRRVTSR
ncbi:hypothetical protein ACLK17_23905 [Escherichia coli]